MDAWPAVNPFVPGHGQVPPCLAGRESEQRALISLLDYLRAGKGSPRNAILSGPRGNGKTALLRWFQREIEVGSDEIDVVWLTPTEMPCLDALATLLVPPKRFSSLRPDTLSFALGIGRLGWELGGRPGSLTRLLSARCKTRPLVLVLDEAHTLDKVVGQALLNSSQSASVEAPFLLAMAGTPGLHAHLNTLSATFWTRGLKIGIGLLDEAASRQALADPLGGQRPAVSFEEDALREVVRDSQCYPYFLQIWGAALWDVLRERQATTVDASVVARARPRFEQEQSAYYEDRRDELKRLGLLDVATRVSGAFTAKSMLRESELDAVLASALPNGAASVAVDETREGLAAVGYVWKPPGGENAWLAGIPSLMTYVAARAE